MKSIPAIWKNGQIVPMQPVDWPDGTPLSVEPVGERYSDESEEDLWGDDPESIARRVAFYEALPPLKGHVSGRMRFGPRVQNLDSHE
jgi:hypothetical protein